MHLAPVIDAAPQLHQLTATQKGRKEFALLFNLNMACLTARTADVNADYKVRERLKAIEHYLYYNQPSLLFERRFIHHHGEIGNGFALHFGINRIGIIYRISDKPNNVVTLNGGSYATANQ